MNRQRVWYQFLLFLVTATMLLACEKQKEGQTEFSILQKNLFLQSIELVESAGGIIQTPGLSEIDIEKAMKQMDQGLQKAFQVENNFLNSLNVRLPGLYEHAFISGVENYRLGVESSDKEKQMYGLNLLSKWGEFWLVEKSDIQQKLLN